MVISRDRWRIGQRDLHRSSPRLFSTVSTKFHLDRKRQFVYEFSVKKLFLGFSRISRRYRVRKKKRFECFMYVFFSHYQWCVRVSASNFCSPICSGSQDTTLLSFYVWPSSYLHTAGSARVVFIVCTCSVYVCEYTAGKSSRTDISQCMYDTSQCMILL